MDWKIYYEDGSTFSSDDGGLEAAPAFGVQCVVCTPDLWGCGDIVGLVQYLAKGWGVVKFGSLTSNANYDAICLRARTDSDFDINTRHIYMGGDYYWFNGR